VELNNSFYRLPVESALHAWRQTTPARFLFAMKGSRFLTHMIKLKDPERGLRNFMERADQLRPKLGPIVFQLPPQWPVNADRFEAFLACLPKRHKYAFEFRNPTWNENTIYKLMGRHNVAYCMFELAGVQSPMEITADFTYIRLHGPGRKYEGSYDHAALKVWAGRIREWKLSAAYVYFDNDQAGYAAQNALQLKELLGV